MGGTSMVMTRSEAESALRWWLEAGVDCATQDHERNWLETARPRSPAAATPRSPEQPLEPSLVAIPGSLAEFREWLTADPASPLASPRSKAVAPEGAEGAEIMLMSDLPTRDEISHGQPIGGAAGRLMDRMLHSIGLAGQAYSANLACFHRPGIRLSPEQIEECASVARRHIALARPKRLLLLGEAPSQALLGKALPQARDHVHFVEGVRTVVTFHPRHLLERSDHKILAWRDLLLLMEENQ